MLVPFSHSENIIITKSLQIMAIIIDIYKGLGKQNCEKIKDKVISMLERERREYIDLVQNKFQTLQMLRVIH